MAKSVNQKGKILYLEKILLATDEKHTCSMQDILSQLMECGIKAERKSIYDDMEVLRGFGMDIRFRRGKPGGYYLAGENTRRAEKEHQMEFSVNETGNIAIQEEAPVEENRSTEAKAYPWLITAAASEDDKPLKLVCDSRKKEAVMEALGEYGQYKEKEDGSFVSVVQAEETPEFFGWLASMGRAVVLAKPKKAVQAYRDYLKGILKEYK